MILGTSAAKVWLLVALLFAFVSSDVEASPETAVRFDPKRVKLAIIDSADSACQVRLRTQEVPLAEVEEAVSPSATALLAPVLDVLRQLDPKPFLKVAITNKIAFESASSAAEAPSAFQITVGESWKSVGSSEVSRTERMIAKRALTALATYKPAVGDVTGRVCINAAALFDAEEKGASTVSFDMPADELVSLVVVERGGKRNAAVTIERDDSVALAIHRFTIENPVLIQWDRGARTRLLSGASQPTCVLTLRAGPRKRRTRHAFSLDVPRGVAMTLARYVRVRVAPVGSGVIGAPVLDAVDSKAGR